MANELQPNSDCHNQITRNYSDVVDIPKYISHANYIHNYLTKSN